jgi:UDP-GlcNAc:undecaprenyl-phosphate/decaprenyl-phosphate GlcNAc-1-phosphate transferase
MTILLAALFGIGVSAAFVPVCRALAFRFNCLARPSSDRWHKRATPLFGGVAIVATVLVGALVFGVGGKVSELLLAGSLIFIVGITDDLLTVKPSTKLIAEIAVASVLVFFGFRLQWTASLTIDLLLTMIWIVGVTNAFNLLDNMDGLCAGVALITGIALLASAPVATPENMIIALMCGALGGFLLYNFNPASIFMGDSGSLFLGLMLASLALDSGQGRHTSGVFSVILAPALMLLIPIFDTTLVTVLRVVSGRSASQGGRDHSSHRLVAVGLSERWAVGVLWILAALAGIIGHALVRDSGAWSVPVAALFVLAMVIFAVYLSHVRVYQDTDRLLFRSGKLTPFVVDFMYKRRVAEVTLDACLVTVSYYSAYRLRFDGDAIHLYFWNFLQSLPIVLAIQMIAFFVVGVYRGVWRLFGLMDAVVVAKGVVAGTVAVELTLLYLFRFQNYSRGVFIIYAALLMLVVTASRASFRLISEFVRRRRRTGERLLIYGAGHMGSLAVRELMANSNGPYRMLGFIDDDSTKRGSRVQGYPVLSGYAGLVSLIEGGAVDRVIISAQSIHGSRVQELETLCATHGVALSRLSFQLENLVAVS